MARRGIRALAALIGLTTLTATFAAATAVNAATTPDFTANSTLTIHKLAQPATQTGGLGTVGTGQEVDTGSAEGLEGVEFTVTPVTSINGTAIDLTNSDVWATITPYLKGESTKDTGTLAYGTPTTARTNGDGDVQFTDLPAALYLVEETDPGNNHILGSMRPVFLTLPYASTVNGTTDWLTDVHMYPKNSTVRVTKTVDVPEVLTLGTSIPYIITSEVPALAPGTKLTRMRFTDPIPAVLAYKSISVNVTDPDNANPTPLATPGDYTVNVDGQTVTVELTPAGLAKLTPGQVVQVMLTTTVVNLSVENSGNITNTATVTLNDTTISTSAQAEYGVLRIVKTAQGDADSRLAGAEFQLFRNQQDATSGTGQTAAAVTADGDAVTTFTTGEDGTVTILGLKVGTYWVKETKAPAGFVAKSDPIQVTITAGTATAGAVEQTVENAAAPGGLLPSTGGTLGVLLPVAGGILLAVGVGMVLARRRRTTVTA